MSFKVLIDPGDGGPYKVIHEIDDRRVTRVSLQGRSGEAGAMNVTPDQTECLLVFEGVPQDHRVTLQDVEALRNPSMTGDEAQQRAEELRDLPTATNQGTDVLLQASQEAAERRETDERVRLAQDAQREQEELLVDGAPEDGGGAAPADSGASPDFDLSPPADSDSTDTNSDLGDPAEVVGSESTPGASTASEPESDQG